MIIGVTKTADIRMGSLFTFLKNFILTFLLLKILLSGENQKEQITSGILMSPNISVRIKVQMCISNTTFIAEENNTSNSSESDVGSGDDEDESVRNLAHFTSPNVNYPVLLKRAFLKQHPIQMNYVQVEKTSVRSH